MQLEHGIFFDQHWASLNKMMPVASGGIHAGQMHQLLHLLGEDVRAAIRRRHDRPSDGHPGRRHRQPRRAGGDGLARNEGRDYLDEGPDDPRRGRRRPARRCARRSISGGDVTFNYASTDTPDFVPTATVAALIPKAADFGSLT